MNGLKIQIIPKSLTPPSKASIGGSIKDILKIDTVASFQCCQFSLKEQRVAGNLSSPTVFKILTCSLPCGILITTKLSTNSETDFLIFVSKIFLWFLQFEFFLYCFLILKSRKKFLRQKSVPRNYRQFSCEQNARKRISIS